MEKIKDTLFEIFGISVGIFCFFLGARFSYSIAVYYKFNSYFWAPAISCIFESIIIFAVAIAAENYRLKNGGPEPRYISEGDLACIVVDLLILHRILIYICYYL